MTATDHLSPGQFYHGTTVASGLGVGDMVEPGHAAQHDISSPGHVYFTDAQHRAKKWSSHSAGGHAPGMRVFTVEPTGPYEEDANWESDPGYEMSYQSRHPLRITGRVL